MDKPLTITVAVPTYRRGEVLLSTLRALLAHHEFDELLVVDQTEVPDETLRLVFAQITTAAHVRWLPHTPPGVVGAMNRALREASGDVVLFLDDDIEPQPGLLAAHRAALRRFPDAWAVSGRVTQAGGGHQRPTLNVQPPTAQGNPEHRTPNTSLDAEERGGGLRQDLNFDFDGEKSAWVTNVMAGNLSVWREKALAFGGFDENFIPPVSYRFETDFAKRIFAAGGRIRYEPAAAILHLRSPRGGTRTRGSHLTSGSPLHGVGDYYYALKHGCGWERVRYMIRRPFREVRTKFHLLHPWWIPIKFIGEIRAMLLALKLWKGVKSRATNRGHQT